MSSRIIYKSTCICRCICISDKLDSRPSPIRAVTRDLKQVSHGCETADWISRFEKLCRACVLCMLWYVSTLNKTLFIIYWDPHDPCKGAKSPSENCDLMLKIPFFFLSISISPKFNISPLVLIAFKTIQSHIWSMSL
jgi:hypothetical protein